MTRIYFVRHAQPKKIWQDERTRPLTEEGKADSKAVFDFLKDKKIDVFYSSPYQRSYDTISNAADYYGMEIITDDRLRERDKGADGNRHSMFEKRWEDLDYHEEYGESIHMVQKRNIDALMEILSCYEDKTVVIGTHGTALSAILNYYDPDFGLSDFLRIIDWMPYIVELQFEKKNFISKVEHCHMEKDFQKG